VAVLCLAGCGMWYCLGSVWSEVVGVAALEQAVDRSGGGQGRAELGSSSLQAEINYGEGRDTRRTSGGHTSSVGWDGEIATEDDKLLRDAHGEGPMEGGSEREPDLPSYDHNRQPKQPASPVCSESARRNGTRNEPAHAHKPRQLPSSLPFSHPTRPPTFSLDVSLQTLNLALTTSARHCSN
jgi:hypothetical protein